MIRLILSSYLCGFSTEDGWGGDFGVEGQPLQTPSRVTTPALRCPVEVKEDISLCGAGRETCDSLSPNVTLAPMGSVTSRHHGHANVLRPSPSPSFW